MCQDGGRARQLMAASKLPKGTPSLTLTPDELPCPNCLWSLINELKAVLPASSACCCASSQVDTHVLMGCEGEAGVQQVDICIWAASTSDWSWVLVVSASCCVPAIKPRVFWAASRLNLKGSPPG